MDILAAKNLVLEESQTYLNGLLEIATEAIISADEAQHIVIFNKGAQHIFGYTLDEVIGQPLDILLPEKYVTAHRRHVADFAAAHVTARLMGERQEIFGRRKSGEVFPAEASISKIEIEGRLIFTVVLRDITERKQVEQEREAFIKRLKLLDEATQAITSELSLEQVLQTIAQTARNLLNVRFAALGVHDGQGNLSRFIIAGLDQTDQDKIGALPIGKGLLGLILHEGKSLVINDIAGHPISTGFPTHHPPMNKLLGVPLYSKGALMGAFYLTDRLDGSDFTEVDRQLVEMLGRHAMIAIENANLYAKTQRLAILEERERFARDLHDGIIQSIYGVGLSLDNIKALIPSAEETMKEYLDLSIKSLAQVITDVRNYIFDLRPQALKDKGLYVRLKGLIKELQVNTLLIMETEIAPDIDEQVNPDQASHLFHIAHEALSNVARHAKARRVSLSLVHTNGLIKLQVADDGVGFKPSNNIEPGHHGLANMQARVYQIGATLDLDSAPYQGTRITVTLPR